MQCWGAGRRHSEGLAVDTTEILIFKSPGIFGPPPTCLDHSPARNPPSSGLWNHVLSWIPFYLASSLFSGLLPHRFPSTDSPKCYSPRFWPHQSPDDGSSSPMTFVSISIIIHCHDAPKFQRAASYFLHLKPHIQLSHGCLHPHIFRSKTPLEQNKIIISCCPWIYSSLITHLNW